MDMPAHQPFDPFLSIQSLGTGARLQFMRNLVVQFDGNVSQGFYLVSMLLTIIQSMPSFCKVAKSCSNSARS